MGGDSGEAEALRRHAAERERNGDLTGALAAYEQALQRAPDHPALLTGLARLALRMGLAPVAEAFYRRHLAVEPGAHTSQDGLARALRDQHRYAEAIEAVRPALMAHPGEPILWNTLGTILAQQGDSATALTFFAEALRLEPRFAQSLYNQAGARMDLGDIEGALADCDAAIAAAAGGAESDLAMMRFAQGTMALCLGRLAEGWAGYAARLAPGYGARTTFEVEAPRWTTGEPLAGRSLLVVGEQGLGDEVMFATVLPDVIRALGPDGRLSLAVEPRLVPLFRRSFPGARVAAHATRTDAAGRHRVVHDLGQFAEVELWAPMGAFLSEFRADLDSFACSQDVLAPDRTRVADWRAQLADAPGLKVGFTWRSGLLTGERRRRYPPLESWREVLQTPGVSFVNLQYGQCDAELAEIRDRFGVELWRAPGLDLRDDLDGLAALAASLDLALGCLNATTNIAAAVGTPTWLVAPPGDWPALGTLRLPWYRRTRLFTAAAHNDWSAAMTGLVRELRPLVPGR